MIDANVNLFRWPYRRLAGDEPEVLAARLRARGVTQAWVSSYEGLLCRDIAGVNLRLAEACRRVDGGFFLPFGCVNPMLPGWREDLRRCHEVHRMAGIRLLPNYHGYLLSDPRVSEMVSEASDRGLVLQIALSMEDLRTQQTVMEPADPSPFADLLTRNPRARVMFLNGRAWTDDDAGESIAAVRKAENAYFDIAMNEGIGGLDRLIAATSPSRVVFGSHAPLFYFESALLKVREAGLPIEEERALLNGNAQSFLRSS
jgi:predicted TIM-barrel fold metal-dependent hydrolase